MEAQLAKHTEQIKTLFEKDKENVSEIKNINHKLDDLTDIKIAIEAISISMKHITQHNERQDKISEKQNETLARMNENLSELNEGQRTLNQRVGQLETRVDENEDLHQLDRREIAQNFWLKNIDKILWTVSGGSVLVYFMKNFINK